MRYLPVFQADQNIGTQFPAALGQHKFRCIGNQPAHNADYRNTCQNNHGRQGFQQFGQALDFFGKNQSVQGIHQGCHHNDRCKIDQIIPCLAAGIA